MHMRDISQSDPISTFFQRKLFLIMCGCENTKIQFLHSVFFFFYMIFSLFSFHFFAYVSICLTLSLDFLENTFHINVYFGRERVASK